MITFKGVADCVIKYNKTTKKDWCKYMHNYANNDADETIKSAFEKDIEKSELSKIADDIIKICDLDNLLKSSKFEKFEIDSVNRNFGIINSIDIKSLVENENCEYDIDFMSDLKVKTLPLINKKKSIMLRMDVMKNIRKHELKEHNLVKVVKISGDISKFESEIKYIENEIYQICLKEINDRKLMLGVYENLLHDVLKDASNLDLKSIPNPIKNMFLAKKSIYLIQKNLGIKDNHILIKVCENSNKIKGSLLYFYDELIKELRKSCGNK